MSAFDDGFCDECSYSLDLHDGDDPCNYAKQKAELMDLFFSAFLP